VDWHAASSATIARFDNVVASTLVFEGNGRVQEYLGGYADWVRQRTPVAAAPGARPNETVERASKARAAPKRLSYREQRELDELPARIEALEAEQRALGTAIADPEFYRQPSATITAALDRTQKIEHELGERFRGTRSPGTVRPHLRTPGAPPDLESATIEARLPNDQRFGTRARGQDQA
jgi:hypothetical protein